MKKLLFFFSIAAIVFVIPNQAKASVIYDTFGPGDSYNLYTGWTLGAPAGVNWVQGDAFIPTGSNYVLDSIELAVGLVEGPNTLNVNLMTDSGGTPDAIIESFHFSNLGTFGQNNSPLIGTSSLNPVLTMGQQYWLIASAGDPSTWEAWDFNDQGHLGSHAQQQNGGNWAVFTDNNNYPAGAFRIEGTPGGTPTAPVPEPATLSLLGLGLVGLVFKRRKRIA